jgi:type IV pilus assembly protein PilA
VIVARFLVILALSVFAAGCGSSSNGANTQQKTQDDVLAKSNARTAVTEIESCFVDRAAYTGCEPTKSGVTATTTDTTYTVTAESRSGNAFVVSRDANGALKRSCTTAGDGACPAGGSW